MTSRNSRSDRQLLSLVRKGVLASVANAPSEVLLTGVSGGPDSICLLHLLSRLQGTLPCSLHVVHVQHGLRPGEGPEEAALVTHLSRSLGIECSVEGCDTEDYRRRHPAVTSIEAAARLVRYGCFCQRAASLGATTIAVAHTADDQVETVLMHLFRGSGITGLGGMRLLSRWEDPVSGAAINVLRPLLGVTKADTLAYCARHGLEFRNDPSNDSLHFDRNRMRRQVLPAIRSVYPGADAAVLRLAAASQTHDDFIRAEVERLLPPASRVEPEVLTVSRRAVLHLPDALRSHALRRLYNDLLQGIPDSRTLDLMMHALQSESPRHVDLPRGASMETSQDSVTFRRRPAEPPPPPDPHVVLTTPGEVRWAGWSIRVEHREHPEPGVQPDNWTAEFDAASTRLPLRVRQRLPGDRMTLSGMTGSKKIQDILVDARIPRRWRDLIPLVVGGNEVLWVAGVRPSAHARLTGSLGGVLRFTALPGDPVLAELIADSRRRSL